MTQVRHLLLEEPMLDGCKGYRTSHQALLSLDGWGDARHSRQLCYRLLLKQLLWGEPKACLICSSNNLNADDRVPTQFKKIVVNADPLQPEHFSPDASEKSLCWGTRSSPC
jgi:hypothetical protein